MSKILVTGGTGYIGNALVRKLVEQNHEVFITGRNNEQPTNVACLSYTFHDINWNTISPIDILFHQAAITNTVHKPDSDFYFVNVQCSKSLFGDAIRHGVKKIIYASSCAVYGQSKKPFHEEEANINTPINPYGSSKIILDEWAMPWAQKKGVLVVGLRYSNVYGIGEEHKGKSSSMVYQLIKQMMSGPPRLFKWGEQARDFIHINDIVNANLLALNSKESTVVNVGSGIATSFNRIVEIINECLGTKYIPEYFDNPYGSTYQTFTQCNMDKCNKILGFTPQISIENGILDYIKNLL